MNEQIKFNQLMNMAKFGWFEINFKRRIYTFSDFIANLFGVEARHIKFEDYHSHIRHDYRTRIVDGFQTIHQINRYEATYPVYTHRGEEVWISVIIDLKAMRDKNSHIALGFMQQIESPVSEESEAKAGMQRVNNMLYQLTAISKTLLSLLRNENIDQVTHKILNDLLNQFGAGRAYIFEYDWKALEQSCTYEVVSHEELREQHNLQKVPFEATTWWTEQLKGHHPIILNNLDELPDEIAEEKEILEAQNIKSIMVVPLVTHHNQVWGYAGIDVVDSHHKWSKEDYQWFSSLTNILSLCVELRKSEMKAQHSEQLLRNIFDNTPVGIELYNKDGYLIDANDKEVEIFGLNKREDIFGINIFEHPILLPEVKEKIKLGEKIDFTSKFEFGRLGDYYKTSAHGTKSIITKVTPLYNEEGKIVNYMFINIDNTDTTNAYQRIQEFEDFFSVISKFARVGYFKRNLITNEGYVISQFFRNLEISEVNSTMNLPLAEAYRNLLPEDLQAIEDFHARVRAGEARRFQKEIRVRCANGKLKWLRTTIAVKEYDPANNNIEVIGMNFDITELKETEERLRIECNKAKEFDQLKSAFLANMSHEIRTPLNAIVGFSTLIAEENTNEEHQEYLEIIQKNNELLLQLISDILDLSKIESGTLDFNEEPMNVRSACQAVMLSFSVKDTGNVKLLFDDMSPEYFICTDRNRFAQILTNFINNALKFTKSGSITLSYRLVEEYLLEFSVQDTGIGIAPEAIDNVFDRFVKLNTHIKGTGLGLAICKSIVHRMGGKIGVESELGRGSRFWFTHPVDGKCKPI